MDEFQITEKPKYDGSFNSMVACVAAKAGSYKKLIDTESSEFSMKFEFLFDDGKLNGEKFNTWNCNREDEVQMRDLLSDYTKSNFNVYVLANALIHTSGELKGYLQHRQEDKLPIFERYFEFGRQHPELWQESLL